MKLIALAGKSGVGKDTIAQTYLRAQGYMPIGLADDLKYRAIATGMGTYEEAFHGPKPPALRTWLQEEGTLRGRDVFGEDIWLRATFARMRRAQEEWGIDKFCLTDVRFPNELRYAREAGALVLRIEAPERHAANGMTADQRQHRSETALDALDPREYHALIQNDPSQEAFVAWQVHMILHAYGFEAYTNQQLQALTAPPNRLRYLVTMLTRRHSRQLTRDREV